MARCCMPFATEVVTVDYLKCVQLNCLAGIRVGAQ